MIWTTDHLGALDVSLTCLKASSENTSCTWRMPPMLDNLLLITESAEAFLPLTHNSQILTCTSKTDIIDLQST